MSNTNDLYAQYILGQAGQRGQRGAGMGARIMQQATDGKPIPHWGGVLAKALTGAIGGYVDAQDDARGQERQDALLGQLAARDASQAAQARQFLVDRLMPPGSQGATQQAALTAPVPFVQREPGGGGFTERLVADESGGDPNARNPRSTATGTGQFIESTWRQFAQANPERFAGMTPEQVLAARTDPVLSRQAIEWYRGENTRHLAQAGMPTDDGALGLAHRFGGAGATALLRADPATPIAQVVGPEVMRANPDLANRTAGDVVTRYQQRFAPAQTGVPGAAPRPAANPDETLASNGTPPPAGSDARPQGRVDFMAQADALNARALEAEASPNPRIRALAPGFRQQAQMMERRGTQDAAAVQQQALRDDAATERRRRDEERRQDQVERAAGRLPSGYERGENGQLRPIAGGPADPVNSPLTETQGRSNMFGQAMERSHAIIERMTTPGDLTIAAWRNLPEGAVNMGLSANDQQYFNAVRSFAAGILRKETGAAFGAGELNDVQKRFFPMPGDSPETIAQKAAGRAQAIASMRAEVPGGFRGAPAAAPVASGRGAPGGAAPGATGTPGRARFNPQTGQIE